MQSKVYKSKLIKYRITLNPTKNNKKDKSKGKIILKKLLSIFSELSEWQIFEVVEE